MKKQIIIALATLTALPAVSQEKWDLRKCIDYAIEHNLSIKQLLTQYQYSFIYRIADTEQHRSQQTEPESSYRRLEQGQRRYQHFCHLCLSTNSF